MRFWPNANLEPLVSVLPWHIKGDTLMKFLSIVFGSLLLAHAHANEAIKVHEPDTRTIEISAHMSDTEMSVRAAAVRITRFGERNQGSGSLVQYKDLQLVLTAQHVADAIVGTPYRITHDGEIREGILIYSNNAHDIAVLWIQIPWPRRAALKWNPADDIATIGTRITYSGFPGSHSLMTYRGRVAGYELMSDGSTNILLHTYGYFGCSGSVIYNVNKEIVGILWGIDKGRQGAIEDMIWVSPIQNLNLDLSLRGLCQTLRNEPRACR
jgi:S1-C subfamily serine protease